MLRVYFRFPLIHEKTRLCFLFSEYHYCIKYDNCTIFNSTFLQDTIRSILKFYINENISYTVHSSGIFKTGFLHVKKIIILPYVLENHVLSYFIEIRYVIFSYHQRKDKISVIIILHQRELIIFHPTKFLIFSKTISRVF